MKRKIFSTIFCLFAILWTSAQDFYDGDLGYMITGPGTVSLVSGSLASGDVTIPSTVSDGTTTYNVTSIGPNAFYLARITSVTIAEGITTIDEGAFNVCPDLTNVSLPSTITSIGLNGFRTLSYLIEMKIDATTPPAADISSFKFLPVTAKPTLLVPHCTANVYENTYLDGGDGIIFRTWSYYFNIVEQGGPCALPVTFGNITASIQNKQLNVSFNTFTENNCDHYDIEVSANGQTFNKIAKLQSKALNGNSSANLQYNYSTPIGNLVLGISLLFLGLSLSAGGHKNRKSKFLSILSLGTMLLGLSQLPSCSKKDVSEGISSAESVYVRIAQVDKSGTVHYSKVIKAIDK